MPNLGEFFGRPHDPTGAPVAPAIMRPKREPKKAGWSSERLSGPLHAGRTNLCTSVVEPARRSEGSAAEEVLLQKTRNSAEFNLDNPK